jgi:hypothetical protein
MSLGKFASIARRASYYIPLIPRLGTWYVPTAYDHILMQKPLINLEYVEKQSKLASYTGCLVISKEDKNHFIVGVFTRAMMWALIAPENFTPMLCALTLTVLFNQPYLNRENILELQGELAEEIVKHGP